MNRREFNKAMPLLAAVVVATPTKILLHKSLILELSPMEAAMQSIDLNNQVRMRTLYWVATIGHDSFEGQMTVDEETYDSLIHHSEDLCSGDVHDILEAEIEKSDPVRSDPLISEMMFGVSSRPT